MNSETSVQAAAIAAKKILSLYPDIPAGDPKTFAAVLVQMLSIYPQPVVERAADPLVGVVQNIKFLNIAAIRELLDKWREEYYEDLDRRRPRLPAPPEEPVDEAMKSRITKSLKGFVEKMNSLSGQEPKVVWNHLDPESPRQSPTVKEIADIYQSDPSRIQRLMNNDFQVR